MTIPTSAEVIAYIRAEMARQGITQKKLAERLGVTRQSVAQALSGKHNLTFEKGREYMEALSRFER